MSCNRERERGGKKGEKQRDRDRQTEGERHTDREAEGERGREIDK